MKFILSFFIPIAIFAQEYRVAFYSDFEPISYSEDRREGVEEFNFPKGYEVDLLSAIALIPEADMQFCFTGIKEWDGIWAIPYFQPEFDIALGGITYEFRRMEDSKGRQILDVTHQTATFKQSLLVKAENAAHIKTHRDLNCGDIVGAVRGTTGEYRFLVEAEVIDDLYSGLITEGVVVVLPERKTVKSDGTLSIFDPKLKNRVKLIPPTNHQLPTVRYFVAEDTMIPALKEGHIDAIARGYIGNQLIALHSNKALAVTAIFSLECPKQIATICSKAERAVLYLKYTDQPLKDKLNHYIDYLTDNGVIDYEDWENDPAVFKNRAKDY